MSNKKIIASVAASLSLLAAPSARGLNTMYKLTLTSVLAGTAAYTTYRMLGDNRVGEIKNKCEKIINETFKKNKDGTFEILSGIRKGYRCAVVEVKAGCNRVKKVVISAASKENLIEQLKRLNENGAVIDGECIEEFSDFFENTLGGKENFGDKFEKLAKPIIDIFIRSFMNWFCGYRRVGYADLGIKALQMMHGDDIVILRQLPDRNMVLQDLQNAVLNVQQDARNNEDVE